MRKGWEHADKFMQYFQDELTKSTSRSAYYPGTAPDSLPLHLSVPVSVAAAVSYQTASPISTQERIIVGPSSRSTIQTLESYDNTHTLSLFVIFSLLLSV
jgi:hypothetical protein